MTPRPVPASLDMTVYRIVQEALTNALRYAREAATLVRLSWEPDQLRVEILDDGPASAEGEGSGRGLVGMRERASLVGGRLEAGPRIGGGYAVRAWLPLDPGRRRTPERRDGHASPRPHRRRPGAGPCRVPDDPRGAAGHRGRRGGGRRRGRRPARPGATGPTSS